jgi:DMSO/TMAO reductase YedYZ molybdopterin-dependent catalytic subunit
MNILRPTRRAALVGSAATLAGLATGGCDRLSRAPSFQRFIGSAEGLTYGAQRLLLRGQPLAREFSVRDLSPTFRTNGSTMPVDPAYQAMLAGDFASWRLRVDGLVARPTAYSLAELRALPPRSQITRHDCVEGWSAIGRWTGVPLSLLLQAAGMAPDARFVVFHCADDLEPSTDGTGRYYESIDLIDAFHPQTILAYALNDRPLPVGHGAPIRARIERQLGYKQAKFVMRIEVVDRLERIGRGRGGFWEDRGYEWYAGI